MFKMDEHEKMAMFVGFIFGFGFGGMFTIIVMALGGKL